VGVLVGAVMASREGRCVLHLRPNDQLKAEIAGRLQGLLRELRIGLRGCLVEHQLCENRPVVGTFGAGQVESRRDTKRKGSVPLSWRPAQKMNGPAAVSCQRIHGVFTDCVFQCVCNSLKGHHQYRVLSRLSCAARIRQGVSRNLCLTGPGPAARKEGR
jgi:hypothetical protein